MLGKTLTDPGGVEGAAGSSGEGLGLLELTTELKPEKTLRNVVGVCVGSDIGVAGYEIHAGESSGSALDKPLFMLDGTWHEGAQSEDGVIRGTYLHGVFDSAAFLQRTLQWAGLSDAQKFDYQAHKLAQLDRLADEVEAVWPVSQLLELLSLAN